MFNAMKVCNGCQELPLLLFSAEKNRAKRQQPSTKFKNAVKKSESTFALNWPHGRKCWSKQSIYILSLYIKYFIVQAKTDKYRALRITCCMEQKTNHHPIEVYSLFKSLCFFQGISSELLYFRKANSFSKTVIFPLYCKSRLNIK